MKKEYTTPKVAKLEFDYVHATCPSGPSTYPCKHQTTYVDMGSGCTKTAVQESTVMN